MEANKQITANTQLGVYVKQMDTNDNLPALRVSLLNIKTNENPIHNNPKSPRWVNV